MMDRWKRAVAPCSGRLGSPIVWGLVFVSGWAAPAAAEDWLQGTAFHKQLDTPVGVQWHSNPLRRGLTNLSANQRIAFFVDRRIDPGRKIDFAATDLPLRRLLDQLAQRNGLKIALIGSVVYVGPADAARQLPTVGALRRDEVRRLPAPMQARFRKKSVLQWDELATPRDVLDRLAEQARVEITNVARIPHDLWPKTSLPELSWCDRMTIVLAGFNTTFRFIDEGRRVELVRIPENVDYQGIASKKRVSPSLLDQLRQRFPATELTSTPKGLAVKGDYGDFEEISRLLRGDKVVRPAAPEREKRYTLTVKNQPVGGIVQALARQLKLELQLGEKVTLDQQRQLISFTVKDVTLRQLLNAALMSTDLEYQLTDDKLIIMSKST